MGQVDAGSVVINVRANLATFKSGMTEGSAVATRATRQLADTVKGQMGEARGSMMLLSEEVGVHIPRHLQALIAQIPGVGAAFSAMLPIVGVIAAITIIAKLIEKHQEMKDAIIAAQQAHVNFGTSVQDVFNTLDDKLLTAGIKADELAHNHLAALHKELALLDHQTLHELAQQFDIIAKAADLSFAQLKTSWYEFGSGSRGASDALKAFKVQYDSLLAQGKDKEASDLLKGTLESAEKIQKLQSTVNHPKDTGFQEADYMKFEGARNQLKQQNIGLDEKSVNAQNEIVNALQAQLTVEQKTAELKKAQAANETKSTSNTIVQETNAVTEAIINGNKERQNSEVQRVFSNIALARSENLAVINLALDAARKKHQLDTDDRDAKLALMAQAVQDEMDANNHIFTNDTDALQKKLTLMQKDPTKNAAAIQTLNAQIAALANKHETELNQITRKGVDERSRVLKEFADQDIADAERAARESEAAAAERMRFTIESDKLTLESANEMARHKVAMRKSMAQEEIKIEMAAETAAYNADLDGYKKEIAALDKNGADFTKRLQEIKDKQAILEQKHQLKMTQIVNKGEEERKKKVIAAEEAMAGAISRNIAKSIMEGKNLADNMESLGKTMLEDALANMLKMILIGDMKQAKDAAHAAASAFSWVMQDVPFPANAIIAPIAAAAAFTSVMAFDQGGLVPKDAMAQVHKKEMILPANLSEGLQHMINGYHAPSSKDLTMPAHIAHAMNSQSGPQHHYHIDARGADAGVEQRIHRAMRTYEDRAVARSISAVNDRSRRRSS